MKGKVRCRKCGQWVTPSLPLVALGVCPKGTEGASHMVPIGVLFQGKKAPAQKEG